MMHDPGPAGRRTRRAALAAVVAAAMALATAPAGAQTKPADAQTKPAAPAGMGDASADKKKPVDIEADSMEVQDDKKKAIFIGNVDAKRGTVQLKADRLEVDYAEAKQGEGKKTEAKLLHATGHVTITTPKEVVTSEWARMDVKANKVTMGGNVVVTQGGTVVRGQQLNLDLDTNRSEMVGGRVRGQFPPRGP